MNLGAFIVLVAIAAPITFTHASDRVDGDLIVLNDDGGWCWFQDERCLIQNGKLVFGSVAAGVGDPSRKGDVEATAYDLASGKIVRTELHDQLQLDDHNAPAFLARGDGRMLAVYAKHGPENRFYYRLTTSPGDTTRWSPIREFSPSEKSRITYSNPFLLQSENDGQGRIYNFFRGFDASFKPSYAWSDNGGKSWNPGGVVINVPLKFRHRPYVRYASDGAGTIHLFYTEGHPRNYNNSVYHTFYRDGNLHTSDGTKIAKLSEGLPSPQAGSLIFRGDQDNVAWTSDVEIDAQGRPFVAYSLQRNQNDQDHRYRYARWNGRSWEDHEIAYAGSRLYHPENDYTGNIALDPNDPDTVFISTNVDPAHGIKLSSGHYEIFRGTSADRGTTWKWTAITRQSSVDNIRPLVPKWDAENTALLWLRGTYTTYRDYDLDVVGVIVHKKRARANR